uniref:Uncharacterized protein n=1 Tax=Rhizophagus irregularis (strain DAOM 181602 / DAOM 197198 / MUCL 43194) TaxID=747089 RepID=U9TWZ8_RHIID
MGFGIGIGIWDMGYGIWIGICDWNGIWDLGWDGMGWDWDWDGRQKRRENDTLFRMIHLGYLG